MDLAITDIVIGERDRVDLGDLSDLAASLKEIGLLHPVVVTEALELVAGGRRLAAAQTLGWTRIDVTVVTWLTAEKALRAEADENTCRKPLTPYEASRARERRARILAPKAAENRGGRPRKGAAATQGAVVETSPKLGEVSKARETAKAAAAGTGYSGSTLDKVDKIREVAEQGVIRQGKTEIPAPEPVRVAAREALAEVKVTGAAVDRASKRVEQAIADHVEESAEVRRARLRLHWRRAFSAAMELERFDPDQLAHVLEGGEWIEVDLAAAALAGWYERLRAARPTGLELIDGGRS